jgi:hypothetical protein
MLPHDRRKNDSKAGIGAHLREEFVHARYVEAAPKLEDRTCAKCLAMRPNVAEAITPT